MAFSKSPNDDVICGDWHGHITIFSRDDEDAYVVNKDFEYSELLSHAHRVSITSHVWISQLQWTKEYT